MKRPALVVVVNVLQSLLGLVLAGLAVYLLTLTHSRETLSEPDASETVHGLLIGAAVLGVPALITMIAAWGLWNRQFWGWMVSLATDVGMLAVLASNNVSGSDRDGDEIALAVGFVVPIALLLLPAVRKFYWNPASTPNLSS